jgi:hypothetical protein
MTDATASWQPDPTGRHDHRYWDGSRWTEHVADVGVAATDPYEGTHGPPAAATEPSGPAPQEPAAEVGPTDDTPATGLPTADAPAPDAPTADATTEPPTTDAPTVETAAVEPTTPMATTPADPTTPLETTTADPTAEAPVTAAPMTTAPLATEPVATEADGESPGGGSSRSTTRIAIGVGVVAVVAIILAVIVLAGGDSGTKDKTASTGPLASTTSITSPLGFPNPSDAGSFQDLLAHEYETGFHLSKDKADCLAKAMTEAITSGKVVQGDATSSDFFKGFLDACHVSLDDLDPTTG